MTPSPNHSFGKEERLCRQSAIQELFANGKSFFSYPFRVVASTLPNEEPFSNTMAARVLFSVPKRAFKRAVSRNRIRRRAREAYRKNRISCGDSPLLQPINVAYIYIAKREEPYRQIEESIQKLNREIALAFCPTT
ncbi:MAG: ribonuclease P protein component [Bacteroidales bacterium]